VVSGILAFAIMLRRLLKRYSAQAILLFLGATLTYLLAIWLDDYQTYLSTGQPNAINGRYLFPILPFLLIFFGLGFSELLKKKLSAKLAFATVVFITMLLGGGALTYILRSDSTWYWSSQVVDDVNHAVQVSIGPLIPGYRDPSAFLSLL